MTEEGKTTVGQYLRRERERQNKSLESIAQVTRITLKNLEALEADNFQAFSAPVFIRGFLRTYAAYLGLDPQEAISLYVSQMDASAEPHPFKPFSSRESRSIIKYLLPLIAIVFVLYIIYQVNESQKIRTPPSSPLASSAPTPAAEKPAAPGPHSPPRPAKGMKTELRPKGEVATKAPSPPKVPPKILPEEKKPAGLSAPVVVPPSGEEKKAAAGLHVLTVKASAVTWMRIRTGEPPDIDVILRPNEAVTYKTKRSFKIDVGNAGGVELIFDGQTVGPLGKSGEVVHLILPPQSSAPEESTPQPSPRR